MNRKLTLVLLLLTVVALAGVPQASAFPGQTQACNGCHTISSSISVITNITSITVSPNQSFAVGINWSGGLTGPAGETEVNWPSDFSNIADKRNNSQFNPTPRIPAPADAGANGTTSSVLTAPEAVGNYIVRIYTSSGTSSSPDGTNFKDINVTVTAPSVNGTIAGTVTNASSGLAISGATVTANGITATTNATGNYSISIAAGTYNVTANATGYLSNTTTGVVVTSGNVTTQNFALIPAPKPRTFNISGFKINDTNGNGVWDSGEMGIENWNIMLLNNTGVQLANTSTNASGFYQFTNIFPGNYNIAEEMKPGFTSTNATSMPVTVENMDVMNVNFTNKPVIVTKFNISGFKINGTNGNGMGIENWNIILLNDTGLQIANTMTDSMGFYNFTGLTNGTYNVTEGMKTGWMNASPTSQNVTINGADATNVNFTNILISPALGSISGTKFNDSDGNGIRKSNEAGLPNWTIVLKNSTGATVATATTDANGNYSFTNLSAGNYTVGEVLKSDWKQTAPPTGTYNVTITSAGENVTAKDFGNMQIVVVIPTFTISGFKINDTNGNGVWDQGEMGIPNWKIMLLNDTGVQLANTSTDASGFYQFMDIFPGKYNIAEEVKPGFTPTNATSVPVTVENMDVINVNFTNMPVAVKNGSISGFKINAANGMGLQNWTIRLIGIVGKGTGTRVIRMDTTTDANGFYMFNNLPAGRYILREELQRGFVPVGPPVKNIVLALGENSMNNNFTNRPIQSLVGKEEHKDEEDHKDKENHNDAKDNNKDAKNNRDTEDDGDTE